MLDSAAGLFDLLGEPVAVGTLEVGVLVEREPGTAEELILGTGGDALQISERKGNAFRMGLICNGRVVIRGKGVEDIPARPRPSWASSVSSSSCPCRLPRAWRPWSRRRT